MSGQKVNFRGTPLERFQRKLRISTTCTHNGTPCWEWLGGIMTGGYAEFWTGGSRGVAKMVRAHRWAYEHFVGPIPEGLDIDHLCRHAWCVNPEHLEPVTDVVNIYRGISPQAINAGKLFCKRGHPLTGENVLWSGDNHRRCRICTQMMRDVHLGMYYLERESNRFRVPESEWMRYRTTNGFRFAKNSPPIVWMSLDAVKEPDSAVVYWVTWSLYHGDWMAKQITTLGELRNSI